MSLRLQMLQVMRLAPRVLGDSSELVRNFLVEQIADDGGFKDRSGRSDLYYTVFGLDAVNAFATSGEDGSMLPPEVADRVINFIGSHGDGDGLDFVHLCCLARCWAGAATLIAQGTEIAAEQRESILRRIETFRAGDGGYHQKKDSASGTAYATFLAFGAYQDLGGEMPRPLDLVRSLKFLETSDGAWANERNIPAGSTNATAAAISVLSALQMPVNDSVGHWLSGQAHPQGGFKAAPSAPIPDLLSTATALHALSLLQIELKPFADPCLDFIDTLWTNEGGFHGHWSDDAIDCEYTFYGLLALGHLSVA